MGTHNKNYTFKLGKTKFDVDISDLYKSNPNLKLKAGGDKVPHYHAKHELFFVGEDPLYVYDGETMLEFSDCIVYIPAFYKHYSIRSSDRRILFSFEPKEEMPCGFSQFMTEFFPASKIFSFTVKRNIDEHLDQLDELVHQSNELNNEAAESVLKIVFYNIYTSNSNSIVTDFSAKESYLIIIEKFINSYSLDPDREVNLETVAEELHLGKRQTSRIIYKYFKKTLSELVNEKRLSIAVSKLAYTDMSISEIAKAANFKSENYFFLQFKRAFGTTPLNYRKKFTN